jgi:uncharacterized protein
MKEYYKYINYYGKDILKSKKVKSQKQFIQHGNVSVYDHTYSVAVLSLYLADKLNINVDEKSLVRGALLHDYFLYDWHVKDKSHRLHGYTHANTALKNAKRDFKINKIEENMIKCHMFPLNLFSIPKYKEAKILCICDKLCAISETLPIKGILVKISELKSL